jgi:hypothetical protein
MLKGDISNQLSPAVVIDIDGIIIEEFKFDEKHGLFKRKPSIKKEVEGYKVIFEVYPILENMFYNDISIYLFAHRNSDFKPLLEEKFEELIYTKLYVGGIRERETLLNKRHVHWYYYKDPAHVSLLSKHKECWVQKWNELTL